MMIGLATRCSRLSSLISKAAKEKSTKTRFSHEVTARVNCVGGYTVTCNNRNLFSGITSSGERLSIDKYNSAARKEFSTEQDINTIDFDKVSSETLESLSEYFDELIEEATHLTDADVSSGDGVLTVKFGKEYGTYVINRQVPNQQIWLSSPKSGPKRYDFVNETWIYKHDGKSMHELLDEEIPEIVKFPVSFSKCSYSVQGKKV